MNGWTGNLRPHRKAVIKANLPVGKSTRLLTSLRETNSGLLKKLESIPKSKEGILVQRTLLLKVIERSRRG